MKPSAPEFPLRVIFDDGELLTVDTPEALLNEIDSIDSTTAANEVWVRDGRDRTVLIRMSGGEIQELRIKE